MITVKNIILAKISILKGNKIQRDYIGEFINNTK
jgi:hypothetical protein